MLRWAAIAVALCLSSVAPAVAADEDDPPCYDAVVIGRYLGTSNFANLNDIRPPPNGNPDAIWWGGYADFRISIEAVSSSKRMPSGAMTVQVITASDPLRYSPLFFYLRKEDDGGWFAIRWGRVKKDWLGRYFEHVSNDGLKRCAH